MPPQRLLTKVNAALDRFPPARHLGVAVSGGPDSVALLSALVTLAAKRGLCLTVLHVNHALRQEAEQEQHLVESLCRDWQIPCVVELLSPPPARSGIESWARTERYQFFQTARKCYRLDAVALAHTLDDQTETVLFRLLRGSARRGLAGIPPTREGWIIRPLLGCTRAEVMDYVTSEHLPFAIDASNADLHYTRNKIRHVLLPFLEREFSPQLRHHLAALAEILREEEAWLESLATAARERVQESPAVISLDRLAAEPVALHARILRQWLAQCEKVRDVGFHHLQSLLALSTGHIRGKIEISGQVNVRRTGRRLLLEAKLAESLVSSYCYPLSAGQQLLIAEAGWQVSMSGQAAWQGALQQACLTNPWQAIFDAGVLPAPVVVRSLRPGDRIHPLGMKGRKKVQGIFIDAKVPVAQRRLLPLIATDEEVAWVPGYVRGEVAKVTSTTRWVYQIEVNPLPEK
ncbi:MAG: tRNA lysidine(34) synthetase TilS [Deltaproteobacteria bacterium]|nr:tRNA lysidine(34) synthetase TilS [Deltaproteobacteria bacterium]